MLLRMEISLNKNYKRKLTAVGIKQHKASLTNIEITEQNIKAFSVVAKKYDIDYALKKDPTTEPPHYYVFFRRRTRTSSSRPSRSSPP